MIDDGPLSPDIALARRRSSTRWRAIAATVAVALGIGLAWLLADRPAATPQRASAAISSPGTSLAVVAEVRAAPISRPTSPPASASSPESCGVTSPTTSAEADDSAAIDLAAQKRIDDEAHRLSDLLRQSSDERSRAAGLVLRHAADLSAGFAAERSTLNDTCGDDTGCIKSMRERPSNVMRRSGEAAAEALAHDASVSRDPLVYSMGLRLCQWLAQGAVSSAPSCQLLSADQWARLDPENSNAWLQVAEAAADRRDDAAVADAMNRFVHASENRNYADEVGAILDAATLPGPDEASIWMMGVGEIAPFMSPPVFALVNYCSSKAVSDANRSQACDAIAHALTERGGTFTEQTVGFAIGRRLGWDKDRTAAMREATAALAHAYAKPFSVISNCVNLGRARAAWKSRTALGEVASARAAAAKAGKTMATLVAEAAADRAADAAAARRAAESASATSVK